MITYSESKDISIEGFLDFLFKKESISNMEKLIKKLNMSKEDLFKKIKDSYKTFKNAFNEYNKVKSFIDNTFKGFFFKPEVSKNGGEPSNEEEYIKQVIKDLSTSGYIQSNMYPIYRNYICYFEMDRNNYKKLLNDEDLEEEFNNKLKKINEWLNKTYSIKNNKFLIYLNNEEPDIFIRTSIYIPL